MRNREEILLGKKSLNIVDEMQLGLINLEKSYLSIRDLVAKVFDQTVREGRRPPPATTVAREPDDDDDIQFK